MTFSIRGGAGPSTYYAQPQPQPKPKPFDELKLEPEKIQQKTAKLEKEGYFSVRMSEHTKSYLLEQSRLSNPAWRNETVGKVVDLRTTEHERSVTAVAKDIAASLTGRKQQLRPHEFQLRRADNPRSEQWHQDRAPLKVICISAIEGRGTEFVTSPDSKAVFTNGEYAEMNPVSAEVVAQKTKEAKQDRFYFFAGKGITEESIPKLVHRSPSETGRSIFMARWK
ncbi:DUF1826 domain-containing protein [Pseudomonas syringae]|uniref:DUF1826 domain-containing protein n=1 Tax=Pseudomonas syringae TaxID=317 RepID=UPI001F101E2B|nr:type III effector HopAZ1 [Pseudomonas syringae]MCH5520038.1 type III effector HopAZ1 [Pseudomonas syringae pv. lapsa]